jgi:hypothetical protein
MRTSNNEPAKFSVGFGCNSREAWIYSILESDHTLAVILASVHFEWVLKRTILALGNSPTSVLRKELAETFLLTSLKTPDRTYSALWHREITTVDKRAAFGRIVSQLPALQNKAMRCRGKVIHGNGTLARAEAKAAVELFLKSAGKMRQYALKRGVDIDSRLHARRKATQKPKTTVEAGHKT